MKYFRITHIFFMFRLGPLNTITGRQAREHPVHFRVEDTENKSDFPQALQRFSDRTGSRMASSQHKIFALYQLLIALYLLLKKFEFLTFSIWVEFRFGKSLCKKRNKNSFPPHFHKTSLSLTGESGESFYASLPALLGAIRLSRNQYFISHFKSTL